MARYEQIPADSVYKRRAKPRYEEARTLLVAEHMAAADKERAAGRCADVRTEAAEIIRLDPQQQLIAREIVRLCRARARAGRGGASVGARAPSRRRAAERRRRRRRRGAPPRAERRAEPAAPRPRPRTPRRSMKQAREAWLRQQCGAAMDLSRGRCTRSPA